MRRNVPIYLLRSSLVTTNELGDPINNEPTRSRVLAEKGDVRQSEFYQAASTRFKPEIVFKVWPHEYKDETRLEYNNTLYRVIRTFSKDFRTLELICERERDDDGDAENSNED